MMLAQKLGELHKQNSKSGDPEAYFMKGLSLVQTVEPCFMCSMALTHSRIARVYFLKKEAPFALTEAQ